jgi:hypothetical protein
MGVPPIAGMKRDSAAPDNIGRMNGAESAIDQEWIAFPDLPGTHLSWSMAQRRTWEIVSKNGDRWATLRPPVDSDGCRVNVKDSTYVLSEDGGHVRRTSRKYQSRQVHAIGSNGSPIMSWTGGHYSGVPGTVLSLADGRRLSFPVRRSGHRTLMSAVEEGGSDVPLITYRLTRGTTWLPPSLSLRQIFSVKIVVSPDALSIQDVALLVAVSSHLPWFYSLVPGG